MTDTASLTLEDLHKRYGHVIALSNVNLTLNAGEITALLGPSGAGKSTLLRLVAGLELPTSGSIRANTDLISTPSKMTPPEQRGIGLVFQDFALFPNMTAAQNVAFALKGQGKTKRRDIALQWLKALGVAHRADAYPHQLSGGEQQRVAIARTIAAHPKAIMMDEPFSGLDPDNRDAVREASLNAIRKANIPALLVTHDPEEALAHADNVSIMARGEILQTGTPDDVYIRPASKTVASAFGSLYSLGADAIPQAWIPILPQTNTKLFYRAEAFHIENGPTSEDAELTRIYRVGAAHRLHVTLGNGSEINFTTLLNKHPKIGDIVSVRPRPDLVYAF
ncbi:MAG: ABC transporter ATP-binding protein [Pseudomonadota bacterium]